MTQQYLIAKARNLITGQTVMEKDLGGTRLELRQRSVAEGQASRLADKMSRNTGQPWTAFVEIYSPQSQK